MSDNAMLALGVIILGACVFHVGGAWALLAYVAFLLLLANFAWGPSE